MFGVLKQTNIFLNTDKNIIKKRFKPCEVYKPAILNHLLPFPEERKYKMCFNKGRNLVKAGLV